MAFFMWAFKKSSSYYAAVPLHTNDVHVKESANSLNLKHLAAFNKMHRERFMYMQHIYQNPAVLLTSLCFPVLVKRHGQSLLLLTYLLRFISLLWSVRTALLSATPDLSQSSPICSHCSHLAPTSCSTYPAHSLSSGFTVKLVKRQLTSVESYIWTRYPCVHNNICDGNMLHDMAWCISALYLNVRVRLYRVCDTPFASWEQSLWRIHCVHASFTSEGNQTKKSQKLFDGLPWKLVPYSGSPPHELS